MPALLRFALLIPVLAACAVAGAARAADPIVDPPLDPLQRAVVESLSASWRTTPAEYLDAAVRAASVDAGAAAAEWFAKVVTSLDDAGPDRPSLMADLGDGIDAVGLGSLERLLATRDPDAGRLVAAIRAASLARRHSPEQVEEWASLLGSPSTAEGLAAADQLARTGVDALPAVVPLVSSTRPEDALRCRRAREIITLIGSDCRDPLLDWLASSEVEAWPGIMESLDLSGSRDIAVFLLAPAVAADAPEAVSETARRILARHGYASDISRDTAMGVLAARLDRVLRARSLPDAKHPLEPIRDPGAAAVAFGGSLEGVVERAVWDATSKRFVHTRMTPRAARAREAMHLAGDLAALDPRDPSAVRLVLLARMEALLVAAGSPSAIAPQELRKPLTGPDGFSVAVAADVLDDAIARGMLEAAAGVAAALAPPQGSDADLELVPATRKALVRALGAPDAGVQFAAARTLALTAGDPPYAGSSRVLEALLHAATATGTERAVVAHPDALVLETLATDVSRFGYEPIRATTGREALFAARGHADTVLVVVAARLSTPSAVETAQLLRHQGLGGTPPVLVVVDPLDDDEHGRFLASLRNATAGMPGVAIVDRLDSMFRPMLDDATGAVAMLPRFPDMVARTAGPVAIDPASREAARRERLARAHEAFTLLALLSKRGWDVSPAVATAQRALDVAELFAPATALLGSLASPAAQDILMTQADRHDLPDPLRRTALAAFSASVEHHGMLLRCDHVQVVIRQYNLADDSSRTVAGDILGVLEAADRGSRTERRHASPPLPSR